MHAIVVQVTFKAGRQHEAMAELEGNVVPGVKKAEGFVGAYWMRSDDALHGVSVELFDTLEHANAEMGRRSTDLPEQAPLSIDSAAILEVIANA
jgi:quinol monooxygenase YgiN